MTIPETKISASIRKSGGMASVQMSMRPPVSGFTLAPRSP